MAKALAAPPPLPLTAKWPAAIGLLSLIVGIAHVVIGGVVQALYLGYVRYQYGSSYSTSLRGNTVNICASMTSYIISGVILLIAGILLLRRRPMTRAFHCTYAVVSLFTALVVIGIEVVMMFQRYGAAHIITGITLLLNPYPVFCLIWFSRADVLLDIQEMEERYSETRRD
jgi:hypothetical protein